MNNTYTVVVMEENKYDRIKSYRTNNKALAISKAKTFSAEYSDKLVYIEFDRKSDGQQGYINKDGFSITGTSWTEQQ